MLMPNTSLMIAGHDLRMLGDPELEAGAPRAPKAQPAHRGLSTLTRLAHQVMSLFF